jgi:dynein heavy chain
MAELNEKFRKQMTEKQYLEDQASKTKKKINTARTLISSLTDERDRWAKFASEIGE